MVFPERSRYANIVQMDGSLPVIAWVDEHRGVMDRVDAFYVETIHWSS